MLMVENYRGTPEFIPARVTRVTRVCADVITKRGLLSGVSWPFLCSVESFQQSDDDPSRAFTSPVPLQPCYVWLPKQYVDVPGTLPTVPLDWPGHLLASAIAKALQGMVRVAWRTRNLKSILIGRSKDMTPIERKPGVYAWLCTVCESYYIGKTRRALECRIADHVGAAKSIARSSSSAVAYHSVNGGVQGVRFHPMHYPRLVIPVGGSWHMDSYLAILEALTIRKAMQEGFLLNESWPGEDGNFPGRRTIRLRGCGEGWLPAIPAGRVLPLRKAYVGSGILDPRELGLTPTT